MKKVFLLFVIACLGLVASAQKVYFIYLQTEDQSPFYVRMGDKIYSSAAAGFLIIPNLVDTTYYLGLGFAKSTDPETKFSVAINQNDRGFLIKRFDDGLSLFDFEELSVVKSNMAPKDSTLYETKTDAFSNLLSKAANDPSIVKVPVVKKDEPIKPKAELEKKEEVVTKNDVVKPAENPPSQEKSVSSPVDTTAAVPVKTNAEETVVKNEAKVEPPVKTDTVAIQPEAKETTASQQPSSPPEQQAALPKEEPAIQQIAYKPSVVTRRSESSTTEGFGVVYFDKTGDATDTIRILIPSSKIKLATETESNSSPAVEAASVKETPAPVAEEGKKNSADSSVTQPATSSADAPATENATTKKMAGNTACSNSASDKDFLRLRKKMAAKENDDEMITEAKKEFKNKCYTVEQIRNLSALFLTSAAKYQFFDVAYQHTSDVANFASLGSEIKDDYYQKRFKALIGE